MLKPTRSLTPTSTTITTATAAGCVLVVGAAAGSNLSCFASSRRGEAHGGELIARLKELCPAPDGVDVGMAYRTLREFEAEGLVESGVGDQRRAAPTQ